MRLVGVRCSLRPFRHADADSLARHANNIKVARQVRDRFPYPYTLDHARQFLEIAGRSGPDASLMAIEVDGQAVGGVGIRSGSDIERFSGEIGYWIGESYWGRGIATEAVTLLTTHAFDRLNLLRLSALPFADNAASVRVLEKAGYVREGLLHSSAVKYGRPRDQLVYARVNAAWRVEPQV